MAHAKRTAYEIGARDQGKVEARIFPSAGCFVLQSAVKPNRQRGESAVYIPHLFREDDPSVLLDFMRAHSFITLVTVMDGVPFASHVPVVIETGAVARENAAEDTKAGIKRAIKAETMRITGHLAKANPQWRSFGAGEALAIFGGPHAYISPALYEKFESVPTWNYVAVHAYGPVRIVAAEEQESIRGMMDTLIATYDAGYQPQWEALPDRYREGMLQGVVGFEMTVTRLEGKYKLSQNRSAADRVNVAAALAASADSTIRATGEAMRVALQRDQAAHDDAGRA
jgi:transcriptional regulator